MKFMLLCYDDEAAWQQAGEAELRAAMDEAAGMCREIDAKGQYVLAAPLHPVATATSVRLREGKRLVTDGPFAALNRIDDPLSEILGVGSHRSPPLQNLRSNGAPSN